MYMEMEENKVGLDYWIVNKIVCSLEGSYPFEGYYFWRFKGVLA